MNNDWYYRRSGAEIGPVSERTLQDLISRGVVGQADEIRLGDVPWTKIGYLASPAQSDPSPIGSDKRQHAAEGESRKVMREALKHLHDRDVRLADGPH